MQQKVYNLLLVYIRIKMILSLTSTFILSFLLIKSIIIYAQKLNLLDTPNNRSTHRKPIPLGAGIGFISAIIISLYIFHPALIITYWYIFFSIFIILFIGILDDVYFANPKMKISAISIAVILLWLNGVSIHSLGLYMGQEFSLKWFSLPFTLFAVVTFTNSLNLIDGIDGLAALVSVVIISILGYIGYQNENELVILISLFTLSSLLSFIIFNYHPAKIFMGDSGSLTLGFIIALLSMLSLQYIHPIALLYLTALPLYDTLNVITRRIRKGNPIFQPDNTHTHHMLLRFIGDKDIDGKIINGNKRTVWILTIFQVMLSLLGLVINKYIYIHNSLSILALILFIIIFIIIYILFTKLENRK